MNENPEPAALAHPFAAAFAARALEGAIAGYLAFSPAHRDLLPPLAGKVLALRLKPFGWTVWLCPTESEVQVLTEFSGTADAIVSGDVSAFARAGLGGAARDSLVPGEVGVEGDAELVDRLRLVFAGLDRGDAATVSAPAGGPAAALVGLLQAGLSWGGAAARSLQTDLAEFWQEESRELPSRPEVDAFAAEVERLRADADRLAERLRRLEQPVSPPP